MPHAISSIIGLLLLAGGMAYSFYWGLRFLVAAYNRSLWWFFGCLFLPLADVAFLVSNFKLARKSYILSWVGLFVAYLGSYLIGLNR
jgi:predicted membrane-bound dolichyl-phosphate-mannose-protein mannosyltransferase